MKRNRIAFRASRRGSPDDIQFAGGIGELRCALQRIEADAFASIAYGPGPGEGTNAQLNAVALGIAQLVLARQARA